ncbi:MAG: hypothetical protein HYT70_02445 [Candidatus Aenigmarchaeota archaeon]|nr:hypothetical protein [Candidatus Aenigmarchaeota archaeon]
MVDFKKIWLWYSRESVQKALLEVSKDREVVSVFQDGSFGKRPDILQYPADITQSVANGTVAFHGSAERWNNPMSLGVGMGKKELDNLRKCWDIIIDPDVKDFEISKLVAKEIIKALDKHKIKNYSIKFTGGKGFHIGISFESFPEMVNLQKTSNLYPMLSQTVIEYLKWYLKDQLKEKLLEMDDAEGLAKRVDKQLHEVVTDNEFDPYKLISMDLFGSRHLFRLPFSLHESSLLVSLPINPNKIDRFEKDDATIERAKIEEKFLLPKITGDGEGLIVEALDWATKFKVEERVATPRKFQVQMKEIPENYFPPCIKHVLTNGMMEGKKRSVFILITFLRNMGWPDDKIEQRLFEWNEKNIPPLRANYLRSQLRWHFRQDRNLLPPNCENDVFYRQLGLYDICCKAIDHSNIKNPVNVPLRRLRERKHRIK